MPTPSRRHVLHAISGSVALAALARWLPADDPGAPPRRPNVILIMADDLGYECIGANGCTAYRTPHLDKLAADGARFDHCYAQPLCTPTRIQLMTGMYNVRNYTVFGHMDPDQTTFAHLLKKAGYATCICGKWQLGRDADLPAKLGFDESYLWQHTRRAPRYANPGLEFGGKQADFTDGQYGPDLINQKALDFIERKKDQPFFLYYPMILTHDPFQPTPDSPDWDPKAKGEVVNKDPRHFGEMVQYMDKLIGRLLDKLDQLKLRQDTLVLFLGDNGTGVAITTQTQSGPVKGGKGQPDDSGMHVPMFARWPGVIAPATVVKDLVDTTDFLPTLCAAAGADLPKDRPLDGRSFLPQLKGQKGDPRPWTYCWYARDGGEKAKAEFARNHRYKLHADGRLFDLSKDPAEKQPIAPGQGDEQAESARKLLQSALDQYKNARPERFGKFKPAGGKAGGA